MLLSQLCFAILGFLSGSILFSYHLPLWFKRVDVVKESADHNPGTANAFRLAGVPVGLLCLLMDMAKSFLPVFYSVHCLGFPYALLPLVMAAPALGHALAPWYTFRGGKAIATAFGVLAGLLPFSYAVFALVFWYLFFSLVLIVRPNEKRSIFAFLMFSLTSAAGSIYTGRYWLALGCALLAAVPIVKNHTDLERAQAALDKLRHTAQDA